MTISRERSFDEWLAEVDTRASLGYRPILAALRERPESLPSLDDA
jgi:hypothetical protein